MEKTEAKKEHCEQEDSKRISAQGTWRPDHKRGCKPYPNEAKRAAVQNTP